MITVTHDRGSEESEFGRAPLASQHASLRAHSERVEQLLYSLAGGGTEAGFVAEARRHFDDFCHSVLDHLAFEEREQLLEHAAAAAPRFSRRVEGLLRQHDELRAMLQSLPAFSEVAGAEVWVETHAGFVSFRRLLLAHERAEQEVMQRAYLEDLGGGD